MNRQLRPRRVVGVAILILLAFAAPARLVQSQTTAPAAPADAPPDKPPLSSQELEQLLAPIALYPDSLITQMLMASTYPLEIVQATAGPRRTRASKATRWPRNWKSSRGLRASAR